MKAAVALVQRLIRHHEGQDLIEYGLLVSLIAIVALLVVATVGNTVNSLFWQTFASVI